LSFWKHLIFKTRQVDLSIESVLKVFIWRILNHFK